MSNEITPELMDALRKVIAFIDLERQGGDGDYDAVNKASDAFEALFPDAYKLLTETVQKGEASDE